MGRFIHLPKQHLVGGKFVLYFSDRTLMPSALLRLIETDMEMMLSKWFLCWFLETLPMEVGSSSCFTSNPSKTFALDHLIETTRTFEFIGRWQLTFVSVLSVSSARINAFRINTPYTWDIISVCSNSIFPFVLSSQIRFLQCLGRWFFNSGESFQSFFIFAATIRN